MCQEDPNEESQESANETKYGVVADCENLNVREAPNPDATVVKIIDKDSEVMIDESESTDDFYKVCTASGVEGFCMKQFIAVR